LSSPPPPAESRWRSDAWAAVFLTLTWLFVFPQLLDPTRRVFVGLDLGVIFHPVLHWAAGRFQSGRLPLVTDLALNGAPFAAMTPLGWISPIPALLLAYVPYPLALNLLSALPLWLILLGAYASGRSLRMSPGASILLSFLWAYNGTQMVHLDHIPLTWANAFFPWAFWAWNRREEPGTTPWLWLASALWGLSILTGHFQLILIQGVFFLGWACLSGPDRLKPLRDFSLLCLGALDLSSPRWLHTLECLLFDPAWRPAWGEVDRFFHSWWPTNAVTLFFPWFFGKFQYDGVNDFWGRYHFNETQASLSIAGLFFMLLFFRKPQPRRTTLGILAAIGIAMALGEWSPLYRLSQHLPVFSMFRDPARWWHLTAWAGGLAAAMAWDSYFEGPPGDRAPQRWAWGLASVPFFILALGKAGLSLLQGVGQSRVRAAADFLHRLSPGTAPDAARLAARFPDKLALAARSLDPTRWEVWVPLALSVALALVVGFRRSIPRPVQKACILTLVLLDLMIFRMPYGNSRVPLDSFAPPAFNPPKHRLLSWTPLNAGPYDPATRSSLAFPNTQMLWGFAGFNQHLGRSVPRYEDIDQALGWFSWVYKDRDPLGWTKRPDLLRILGIDRVVSDAPLEVGPPFRRDPRSPVASWTLDPVAPRALWVGKTIFLPWPDVLDKLEGSGLDPLKEAWLDQPPEISMTGSLGSAQVESWEETRLSIRTRGNGPGLLVVQKTFLPGWKARLDHIARPTLRCDGVLIGIQVPEGVHQVDLRFDPTGLRLGFFIAFVFLALGAFGAYTRSRSVP